MGAVDFRRQEVKLTAFKTLHHPPPSPLFFLADNRTLEYHREELQLREMDGAAAVSDLVRTMRLNPTLPSPVQKIDSLFLG